MPRRFPIIQFPNRLLIFAILASLTARVSTGQTRRRAAVVWRLTMVAWAIDEVRRGANWVRRLLGLVIGARHARALARGLQL